MEIINILYVEISRNAIFPMVNDSVVQMEINVRLTINDTLFTFAFATRATANVKKIMKIIM